MASRYVAFEGISTETWTPAHGGQRSAPGQGRDAERRGVRVSTQPAGSLTYGRYGRTNTERRSRTRLVTAPLRHGTASSPHRFVTAPPRHGTASSRHRHVAAAGRSGQSLDPLVAGATTVSLPLGQ